MLHHIAPRYATSHTYMHTWRHSIWRVDACRPATCPHACIHACKHAHMHAPMRPCIHVCMHTCPHAHILMHCCRSGRTHVIWLFCQCSLSLSLSLSLSVPPLLHASRLPLWHRGAPWLPAATCFFAAACKVSSAWSSKFESDSQRTELGFHLFRGCPSVTAMEL